MSRNLDLSLYLVLDPPICGGMVEAIAVVEQSLAAGVTILQIRSPNWKKRACYELALAIKPICTSFKIPLIINDDIDIALACDSDGVHIGQADLPAKIARKLLGNDKIIGLSASTLTEVIDAQTQPVDYLGIGPIFNTTTKPDAAPELGFTNTQLLLDYNQLPCVLIGGLNSSHVSMVKRTGADGIAVVSAICASKQPALATKQLVDLWNES